jgi:hypothetical protein
MHSLLSREMTRKEFLVTSGMLLLGLFGVTALLKNVTSLLDVHSSPVAKKGFGSQPYGA